MADRHGGLMDVTGLGLTMGTISRQTWPLRYIRHALVCFIRPTMRPFHEGVPLLILDRCV